MSVKHKETSIVNRPKNLEEVAAENARLKEKNESLSNQVTDLQLALCEVYEMMDAAVSAAE